MAATAGKRLGSAGGRRNGNAGFDSWQRRWWRCRGRKARLRAKEAGDSAATAAAARRRRQGRKGRKRDGRRQSFFGQDDTVDFNLLFLLLSS
ncbi:hypothetical protein GW17_00031080, partial [Ensete ventricosum]